jgi:hypothetical protein
VVRRKLSIGVAIIALAGGTAVPSSMAGSSTSGHSAINIYDIGPNPGAALDPTGGQPGVEAAIKEINGAGGINGHPIHVTYCNAITSSATLSAQCAQSATTDHTVVADIGHVSVYDQGDPVELAAGLTVSGYTVSPGDTTPTNSFPLNEGGFTAEGQAAEAVKLLNAKRVCQAYIDVPGTGAQATLINQWILAPRHLSVYKNIALPLAASDLSPQAAQASGCDVIVVNSSTQQSIQYSLAVRSLGNNVPLVLGPAIGTSAIKAALGQNPSNIYEAGWFYRNSPGFVQYEKDMSALHFTNTQYDNDISVMGWIAVKEFAAIARHLPSVTRASVLAAYKHQSNVTTMGLTPALNLTVPQSGAGGANPVLRNDTAVLYKYGAGTFHFMGQPQRPFLQIFPGGSTSVALNTAAFTGSA